LVAEILGNFAEIVGFNRQNNTRDIDHGKKIRCDRIGNGDIRVRVCYTIKRRYRDR
jgi:hypothetical protein